jgi:hypothetical protein
MFFTSIFIERIYDGKFRWMLFGVLAAIMMTFALWPQSVVMILNAFLQEFSVLQLAIVILGGIFSGVFINFFCIFFRIIQLIFRKVLALSIRQ